MRFQPIIENNTNKSSNEPRHHNNADLENLTGRMGISSKESRTFHHVGKLRLRNPNPIYQMNPSTTPPPRTDEQIWTTEFHHKLCDVVDMDFALQLERELAEKTNEVARLRELLNRAIETAETLSSGGSRPLPTTNHKRFSSKLVDEPKQEEMPLEDEIETLWEHSEHIDSLTGHMAFKALAKSIRYLREEIQRIDRALNVGEEDSGHNFVEINKLRDEIQKLKEGIK